MTFDKSTSLLPSWNLPGAVRWEDGSKGMKSQGTRGDRPSGEVPTWTIVFELRVVLVLGS